MSDIIVVSDFNAICAFIAKLLILSPFLQKLNSDKSDNMDICDTPVAGCPVVNMDGRRWVWVSPPPPVIGCGA
eukprot:CAMPEP_0198253808 /NCGR_PEP_ID=MMETSP1447-20131203/4188_1 /TAXON_ID=420782 /ORGANISM="Chaetoceros dichaeta, Strain CCMP1751" /LENGTH=72 /DNA_ID=CAMNT_0043939625 /DNA_START=366 /DNA_END=584 /DNA_ORIENTATION=-